MHMYIFYLHRYVNIDISTCIYIDILAVTQRSENVAEDWRRSKDIKVIGSGIPKPCLTFHEASMPDYVLREVLKQGFSARK
jgi:ATP-dependent RNA helicase DDX5/DBP2